jgi:iron complex outermembrane receptor protein
LPIGLAAHPETSEGGNIDFTYKTPLGNELTMNITQTFFATRIEDPLVPDDDSLKKNIVSFTNVRGSVRSFGAETNLIIRKDETNLIVSYTYTDAKNYFDSTFNVALNAKHRLIMDLMWDIRNKWRIGVESFYTGKQYLSSGEQKPDYWILGLLIVYYSSHYQVSLNFENILDERQGRHEPSLYSGTVNNPKFNVVWGPMEGISANISLKISL